MRCSINHFQLHEIWLFTAVYVLATGCYHVTQDTLTRLVSVKAWRNTKLSMQFPDYLDDLSRFWIHELRYLLQRYEMTKYGHRKSDFVNLFNCFLLTETNTFRDRFPVRNNLGHGGWNPRCRLPKLCQLLGIFKIQGQLCIRTHALCLQLYCPNIVIFILCPIFRVNLWGIRTLLLSKSA